MESEKMIERIAAIEQSVKSAHHRIDKTERLTEAVYAMASETKALREDVNRLQCDMDEVRAKPAKRYETVISAIISVITSAAAGYLAAHIF